MTHNVKVRFCMSEFSSINIIEHRFHVGNYKVKSGIGYYMIIDCDLMLQLDLSSDFKHKFLQWDDAIVPMK